MADTRNDTGDLGGPFLTGNQERDFPILESTCIPSGVTPAAYSFNFTAVPHPAGQRLGFLTTWPQGQAQPTVSTLNNPTGTIVANAAIVPAGTGGGIAVFPNNDTDLVIDINGYFAAPGQGGLSLYTLTPCRVLDTRDAGGAFSGGLTVDVAGSACSVPAIARGYVFNATVVPPGRLGFLTLWPDGEDQPLASTLNAIDGAITSNMAIVPTTNGSIDAFASATTQLLLDLSSYLAPVGVLTITTTSLPDGMTGQSYQQQLGATGGEPPYNWTVTSGNLPDGLTLSASGLISGRPTTQGVYSFTVQVTDAFSNMTTANLSITVSIGPLVIITTTLPDGTQGVPYEATLAAGGGTPPYTWSLVAGSGSLPDGLMLNTTSGLISGTPTTPGASNFSVQVQDSDSNMAQAALQIVINASSTNGSLNGLYAFSFNGYYNHGSPIFMAGSFLADGNGNITRGVLDFNTGAGSQAVGYPFTGTYNVTADGLGTMSLNVTTLGMMNFHVAVSNGGNGAIIQDNTDPNARGSGSFYVQTPLDFVVPAAGAYTIGTFGADLDFNRYAKAGTFQVAALGQVTGGTEDLNDNGNLANRSFTGQFQPPSPQSGRGQALLSFPSGITNTYAYYVVSKGQIILLGTDPLSAQDPLTLGTILLQVPGGFDNSSLQGVSVIEASALVPNGGSPQADAVLGSFTADGHGNATTSLDENRGGTLTQQQVSQGTYSVASNGKVTLTGFGGTPPILYLANSNQAFVVGQDTSVASGNVEPQTTPPPFTNLSILGTYLGGTITPVESPIVDAVSFLFADGNGNFNGIQNFSGPTGTGTQNLLATYQVDSTGRAVLTGTPAGIMYVVSTKRIVLLPTGDTPVLSVFNLGQTN